MPWIKMGPEESARLLLDAAGAKRWIADSLSSVRTSRAVPAGAALGPCAVTRASLYDSVAFIACKCADRRPTAYALQIDPSTSCECLHMVQSARNAEEQNLEAYLKNGHLFFRAIKDIPENTELLAWYGRDLAKLLGISSQQKNSKGFICTKCKQSFLFEFPLLAHQRFFCLEKPTSFPKKITIPDTHSQSSKPSTDFHNLAREMENCRKKKITDPKSTKRRRSLESDTDESDGEPESSEIREKDETASVKRFCVNGINKYSKKTLNEGLNSQYGSAKCSDNCTIDPESLDLRSTTADTKPVSATRGPCDVLDDKNMKSAFTLPPRIASHIPLMSAAGLTNDILLPGILPINFQRSALLYKDLPKQLCLLPSTNVWPKSSRPQQAPTTPLQSLLPPSLSTLGVPMQNWCAKCNISFHMTSDLVQHMRSHHKRALSDEKQTRHREERLKCLICKETFRERHHLSRHMTSHTSG